MDDACINLDWLAFSITLALSPLEKDEHCFVFNDVSSFGVVVRDYPGTNIYRHRMIVFNSDGSKMLTLLYSPFSSVIPFRSCLVEVANSYLYEENVVFGMQVFRGFGWVLELLSALHCFSILGLSRVDVCCDFVLDEYKKKFISSLSSNGIYVQRYSEGAMFHVFFPSDGSVSVGRFPKCLSWGSKHSNIKWKLYNKSLELFEVVKEGEVFIRHCSKPYIMDKWRRYGFDCDKVWRIEVSIMPMSKFELGGYRPCFDDMSNYFFLYDFFFSLYSSKFITRLNQGHKDRSNDKRVWLLGNKGEFAKVKPRESNNTREVSEYVSCLRAAMLQRSRPEVEISSEMFSLWTNTAVECVRLGHLEGYFARTYGYDISQIEFSSPCVIP